MRKTHGRHRHNFFSIVRRHHYGGRSKIFNHTKGIISEKAYQKRRKVLLERYKSLYAEFREWYIEQYGEEDFYKNQEV